MRWFLGSTKFSNFDFDYIHHFDGGFFLILYGTSALCLNYTTFGFLFLLLGVLMVIDDIIGHIRAAKGYTEEWILEKIFRFVIKMFWKTLRK